MRVFSSEFAFLLQIKIYLHTRFKICILGARNTQKSLQSSIIFSWLFCLFLLARIYWHIFFLFSLLLLCFIIVSVLSDDYLVAKYAYRIGFFFGHGLRQLIILTLPSMAGRTASYRIGIGVYLRYYGSIVLIVRQRLVYTTHFRNSLDDCKIGSYLGYLTVLVYIYDCQLVFTVSYN